MRAFIMAGGKGTRLYPMTLYMPKQLIMINGYPVIRYVLDHCRKNGIDEFVLCLSNNLQKQHFYNALGDGGDLGVKIIYSIGRESLGTSGRMLHARRFVEDDFIVYYGDILASFDLRAMINYHRDMLSRHKCVATLALCSTVPIEFGVAMEDKATSQVRYFKERPSVSEISGYMVNVGVTVCNPHLLRYCSPKADLFSDVIPMAIDKGEFVASFNINGAFYDVGSFSSLEKAMKAYGTRNRIIGKSKKQTDQESSDRCH